MFLKWLMKVVCSFFTILTLLVIRDHLIIRTEEILWLFFFFFNFNLKAKLVIELMVQQHSMYTTRNFYSLAVPQGAKLK